MRYRRLGTSGLTVSTVGVGCRTFGRDRTLDQDGAREVVHAALDAGITLFDTAASYGDGDSEEYLGAALGSRRDEVVIATKFGGPRARNERTAVGSRRYVRRAVEDSLRRLQTDFIDLYQMHVPDPLTPIDETLAVLHDLVTEGKVRYLGSSNFSAWQMVEAELIAQREHFTRFVSAQNRYNLLERDLERDVVPVCVKYGIGILPFYPLLHGVLTGRYTRDTPASEIGARVPISGEAFDVVDALGEYARARGIGLLEVAIVGLAARPALGAVIAGASRPDQVKANAAAVDWVPSADDLAVLDGILEGAPSAAAPGQ